MYRIPEPPRPFFLPIPLICVKLRAPCFGKHFSFFVSGATFLSEELTWHPSFPGDGV